jgi:putative cardiolipin synthase
MTRAVTQLSSATQYNLPVFRRFNSIFKKSLLSKLVKILYLVFIIAGLQACTSLPADYERTASYASTGTDHTALGKRASEILGDQTDKSAMYVINEGTDAFFARMVLLAKAEKSIDVQYFIWHADLIGKLLFNELISAADRGVHVRVLLDDLVVDTEVESLLYAIDQHDNIEVRLFNPFASRGFRLADFVTDGQRINRRMHNKSFTADNKATIVGGRNIGNEYFSADEESNFNDLDVLAVGPVVNEVEKQFDTYWNSQVVIPVSAFDHNMATTEDLEDARKDLIQFKRSQQDSKYAHDLRSSGIYKRLINAADDSSKHTDHIFRGDVQVVYDDPAKSTGKSEEDIVYLKSLMKPHLDKIKHSFEIVSPYFVPGDSGTEYLTGLVSDGINVRLLTNSLSSTDGIMAQSGYARKRIELLKGGVEIYELKNDWKTHASRSLRRSAKAKSGLHAKTYIFDRKEIFIGSFNFDQRSANINTEVGVVYQVTEMAQLIASAVFDTSITDRAYRVQLHIEHENVEGIEIEQEKVIWIETRDGKEIRYDKDPNTSGWRRFYEDVFSILPIESQL